MEEETKEIEGYNGDYLITNNGKIYSNISNIYRVLMKDKDGYMRICLRGKNFRINRLVAEYFIYNPNNKKEVNHINGNKEDNRVENLEWVSSSENTLHAYDNGLMNKKGENHHHAKLTNEDVLEIRKLCKNNDLTQTKIAKIYNIDPSHVSDIKLRKRWKHI